MQLPDGLDGIRLVRALVRAVAHDAREAQRQTAQIRRARLDAVEGDLHHQLGPHVHHVSVASRLELEQLRRLPLEHLVRHPFERLPEHREASTVTGPKVKIEARDGGGFAMRSEEHTSELQSLAYLVC